MMTKERFAEIVDEFFGHGICDTDVAETGEPIDNFTTRWGQPDNAEEVDGQMVFEWLNIQTAKGRARGDLYLTDCGDRRLAYFSGEAL